MGNMYTLICLYVVLLITRYDPAFSSTPIFLSNLACDTSNPSHLTLYQCPRQSGSSCTHNQDVALICDSPYTTGIAKFIDE